MTAFFVRLSFMSRPGGKLGAGGGIDHSDMWDSIFEISRTFRVET